MEIWQYGTMEKWPKLRDYVHGGFSQEQVSFMNGLFCPPGLYPQFNLTDIYVLMAYLREGLFKVEMLPHCDASVDCSRVVVDSRNSRETDEHLNLKQLATLWLKEKGFAEVDYEAGITGGECDVASRDRSWIVECGATRPSKLLSFLPENPDSTFVVFNRLGIGVFSAGTPEIVEQYRRLHSEVWRKTLNKIRPW